jgi:16S rRNA (guanine(966)-N(2))-methyltransferase RsmD
VREANVLDLFAGAGSLGIEAMSRGARRAVFVDNSARSMRALRMNIDTCGMADRALPMMLSAFQVFRSRKILRAVPYDIVFADPPYPLLDMPRGLSRFIRLLDRLAEEELLARDGIVMARHRPGILPVENLSSLEPVRSRTAGETEVTFLRRKTSTGKDEGGN